MRMMTRLLFWNEPARGLGDFSVIFFPPNLCEGGDMLSSFLSIL